MDLDRVSVYRRAIAEQVRKSSESRSRARVKRESKVPWRAVERWWHAAMERRFGAAYTPTAFKPGTKQSGVAKLLLEHFGVRAELVIGQFVDTWRRPGLPSMGYLLAARGAFAEAPERPAVPRKAGNGVVGSDGRKRRSDDFDPGRDKGPAVGW